MILLTIDEIIMLHGKLLETTGDLPGLRDRGLLESAVFSMNASFEDVEQYPTVEEKAARVAYALIKNHALVDGNKRVGILAMLMTLRLNGVALQYTQQDRTKLFRIPCPYYTVRRRVISHETAMMIFGSLLSALPAVTAGSLVMP